jgi:hypothetical protein
MLPPGGTEGCQCGLFLVWLKEAIRKTTHAEALPLGQARHLQTRWSGTLVRILVRTGWSRAGCYCGARNSCALPVRKQQLECPRLLLCTLNTLPYPELPIRISSPPNRLAASSTRKLQKVSLVRSPEMRVRAKSSCASRSSRSCASGSSPGR